MSFVNECRRDRGVFCYLFTEGGAPVTVEPAGGGTTDFPDGTHVDVPSYNVALRDQINGHDIVYTWSSQPDEAAPHHIPQPTGVAFRSRRGPDGKMRAVFPGQDPASVGSAYCAGVFNTSSFTHVPELIGMHAFWGETWVFIERLRANPAAYPWNPAYYNFTPLEVDGAVGGGDENGGVALQVAADQNVVAFIQSDDNSFDHSVPWTTELTTGEWHQLVVSIRAGGALDMYVDTVRSPYSWPVVPSDFVASMGPIETAWIAQNVGRFAMAACAFGLGELPADRVVAHWNAMTNAKAPRLRHRQRDDAARSSKLPRNHPTSLQASRRHGRRVYR